jgi:NADH:ubiquinone oxidoreductase subunit D
VSLAPAGTPTLLVPDQAHWASAGIDLSDLGIELVFTAAQAAALVVPAELPRALGAAVRELRIRFDDPRAVRALDAAVLPGEATSGLLEPSASHDDGSGGQSAQGEHSEHGDHAEHGQSPDQPAHEGHGGHGAEGHDHGDMMAVTGEPSRDGLVMEEIETVLGPLSPALPTGLTVRVSLDGDVVAEAEIGAAVAVPNAARPADPLARAAWVWAEARAVEGASLEPARVARHLAATEVERALSHLMWLVRFARLLGWPELVEQAERAARPLIGAHRALTVEPRATGVDVSPSTSLERVVGIVSSRRLRRRAHGLGRISPETCRERGLAGPIARASGLDDDLRAADPAYKALGFEPLVREGGDVETRARLRVDEAVAAVSLAAAALAAGELPPGDAAPTEGPRGPVDVTAQGRRANSHLAVGAAHARELAGAMAQGHELAGALVVIASFDLSPWRVGE